MKLNEPFYAAINEDDNVGKSPEGLLIGETKEDVLGEIKAWHDSPDNYRIVEVVLKEVERDSF